MARVETLAEAPPPGGMQEALGGPLGRIAIAAGRVAVSLFVPLVAFLVLWAGFLFLRDTDAPRPLVVVVAIVWGVGGVGLLFLISNWLVEQLPGAWARRIIPFVFVGPAVVILSAYLLVPTVWTLYLSFFDATSTNLVGLDNYVFALTDPGMLTAIRNNLVWLVVGTGLSVSLGLLIAVLADRTRIDRLAKTLIFLPMAISFVGAGVIWRFVYAFRPEGQEQVGLLNAALGGFGIAPVSWLTGEPWNTLFLVAILVWAQTGFAMVVLAAALRGVPDEILEAARMDGANEVQVFRHVTVPSIMGAIVTVATTIAILSLKIFDIVLAMTNGNFGTEVIATMQYKQMFKFFDFGRGSALAIILLVAVMPVVWYNLRRFRGRETFR